MPFILAILTTVVFFEVGADILFKKWALSNNLNLLIYGILLYAISSAVFAWVLKFESLSKAVVIFTVLNFILAVLAGVFLFKEHLAYRHIAGIILGLISVALLSF